MIKINYPKDQALLDFQNSYLVKIRSKLDSCTGLKAVLSKIKLANGSRLTWEYLLTAPFNELIDLNAKIVNKRKGNIAKLKPLTGYKDLQLVIAQFFMEQKEVKLDSCFYCNIDSIYSFSLIGDYKDGLDFVNRASFNQLINFYQIGEATAQKIIDKRKDIRGFDSIDECPVSKTIKAQLSNFDPKHTHNHFTLDHFFHQVDYQYLSLCLYNFVPSCYVCNSKYKGKYRLYATDPSQANPGSSVYSFHKDVVFKLFYHRSDRFITTPDDYSVEIEISDNQESHEVYLDRLNILGRYTIHKKEAFQLVKKKEDYSDSRIKELSNELGKPVEEIKKQIFGREIFESEYDHSKLVKYKRDISKSIKILL